MSKKEGKRKYELKKFKGYDSKNNTIKTVFCRNFKYFMEKELKSQKEYACDFGLSESSISAYKSGQDMLTDICKLKRIAEEFNITVDELISCDMEKRELDKKEAEKSERENQEGILSRAIFDGYYLPYGHPFHEKFLGKPFWLYFFSTNKKHKQKICKGKMLITPSDERKAYLVSIDMESTGNDYEGNLVATGDYTYIYLRGREHCERALIIFNIPKIFHKKILKPYSAGVGIVSSISTGPDQLPCMQKIFLSSKEIPEDTYHEDIKELISINQTINETVRVSESDDDDAYEFVKKFSEGC